MKRLTLSTMGMRFHLPSQPDCIILIEHFGTLWSFWTLLGTDNSSKKRSIYVLSHAETHVGRGLTV